MDKTFRNFLQTITSLVILLEVADVLVDQLGLIFRPLTVLEDLSMFTDLDEEFVVSVHIA